LRLYTMAAGAMSPPAALMFPQNLQTAVNFAAGIADLLAGRLCRL